MSERKSELGGSLIKKIQDEGSMNKLRGTLIKKGKSEISPELQGTLVRRDSASMAEVYIQRDGGKEWTVKSRDLEKDKITLIDSDGSTLTKRLSDFESDINTEGSPWRKKE